MWRRADQPVGGRSGPSGHRTLLAVPVAAVPADAPRAVAVRSMLAAVVSASIAGLLAFAVPASPLLAGPLSAGPPSSGPLSSGPASSCPLSPGPPSLAPLSPGLVSPDLLAESSPDLLVAAAASTAGDSAEVVPKVASALVAGAASGSAGAPDALAASTAGAPVLLRNLYDAPLEGLSSRALPLAPLAGGRALLAATDPRHGREPWVSDGTAAGTFRLRDLAPGPESSLGEDPWAASAGGRGFFLAGSRFPGEPQDLWVTDGTTAGTRRVLAGLLGADRGISLAGDGAGRLFVLAQDRARQPGLWVSDGTAAGTRRLPHAGLPMQRPGEVLAVLGDRVLFVAGSGIGGTQEVWSSDGTAAGTVRLLPGPVAGRIYDGPPVAFHVQVLEDGTAVVLQDLGKATGPGAVATALWRTDGTPAGTLREAVLDGRWIDAGAPAFAWAAPGVQPVVPRAVFATWDFAGDPRLWVSDGTEGGTRLLAQAAGGFQGASWIGDRLLFATVADAAGGGPVSTLWIAHAAGGGAEPLQELPGALEGSPTPVAGGVAFRVLVGGDEELWWSDGTASGLRGLAGLGRREGRSRILGTWELAAGERSFLLVDEGTDAWDLWATDGSGAGTVRLTGRRFFDESGFGAPGAVLTRGGLLFVADDRSRGREPWVSDGTAVGTRFLEDLSEVAADAGSWPHGMARWDDLLLVFALGPDGWGLWQTDGRPETLQRRHRTPFDDPHRGPEYRAPEPLVLVDGRFFFVVPTADPFRLDLKVADLPRHQLYHLGRFPRGGGAPPFDAVALRGGLLWAEPGERLVVSDGAVGGVQTGRTRQLDLRYDGNGDALALLAGGEAALVAASRTLPGDPSYRPALWRTDGTEAGSWEVLTTAEGAPTSLEAAPDGSVWFSFGSGAGGDPRSGLWRSDGTPEGTIVVEHFGGRRPILLQAAEGGLFVVLPKEPGAGGLGQELWLRPWADGPPRLLLDGAPEGGPLWVNDGGVPFRGGLLFTAHDELFGSEPWVSDGTAAGTRRLGDLAPGAASSFPAAPVVRPPGGPFEGETAFFAALGRVWRTAGSPETTVAVHGDPPRWRATGEMSLAGGAAGDRLVVAAETPALGREPWSLPVDLPALPSEPLLPPAPPSDLAARSGVGSIWLSWAGDPMGLRSFDVQVRSPGDAAFRTLRRVGPSTVGTHGVSVEELPPGVPHTFRVRATNAVASSGFSNEATASILAAPPEACVPGIQRLCLLGGRFAAEVFWRDPRTGDHGQARAVPFPWTDVSGTFWFFRDGNVELIVKALDGSVVNRRWWVFGGGLTDVEYWLKVTDAEGSAVDAVRWYHHPSRNLCGFADTGAFPGRPGEEFPIPQTAASGGGAGGETLDLLEGRYRVSVDWRDPRSGDTGHGRAIPGSDNTGFFWFFRDGNVELVVKVLDGTPVNGRHWVFWGGLTDVEYELRVTDLETGVIRNYLHAAGDLCGGADTEAFDPQTEPATAP